MNPTQALPEGELASLIKQAKEEMGVNPRMLNARLQAIANGYTIASSLATAFIHSGGSLSDSVVIDSARAFSDAFYQDVKKGIEENSIAETN